MIRRCLEKLALVCEEATDGAEAVKMATEKQYDLIVMDSVMPNMNGMEATSLIRQAELAKGRSGLCIIGLTGNALSEDVAEFRLSGCDEVTPSPLSFQPPRYFFRNIERF